jgi:hypothetical protein
MVEIILSILGLLGIGGITGAYFNHRFETRRETERRIAERKEKQYRDFLENLLAFFEGWSDTEKKKKFMVDLYTHAPLYASDEVMRLANEFLKSFKDGDLKHGGQSDIYYRKLVLAIRKEIKELNKQKNNLKEEDIEILKLNY